MNYPYPIGQAIDRKLLKKKEDKGTEAEGAKTNMKLAKVFLIQGSYRSIYTQRGYLKRKCSTMFREVPPGSIMFHRFPLGSIMFHRFPLGSIMFHRFPLSSIGYGECSM